MIWCVRVNFLFCLFFYLFFGSIRFTYFSIHWRFDSFAFTIMQKKTIIICRLFIVYSIHSLSFVYFYLFVCFSVFRNSLTLPIRNSCFFAGLCSIYISFKLPFHLYLSRSSRHSVSIYLIRVLSFPTYIPFRAVAGAAFFFYRIRSVKYLLKNIV